MRCTHKFPPNNFRHQQNENSLIIDITAHRNHPYHKQSQNFVGFIESSFFFLVLIEILIDFYKNKNGQETPVKI